MTDTNKTAPKKDKIPRQPMPEQSPEERQKNFEEVPYGYSPETAMLEASRCIQCKKPRCVAGCPVGIDIPGFIKAIEDGDFPESILSVARAWRPPRSERRARRSWLPLPCDGGTGSMVWSGLQARPGGDSGRMRRLGQAVPGDPCAGRPW